MKAFQIEMISLKTVQLIFYKQIFTVIGRLGRFSSVLSSRQRARRKSQCSIRKESVGPETYPSLPFQVGRRRTVCSRMIPIYNCKFLTNNISAYHQ